MEIDENKFIEGFNAGYLISIYEKELANVLSMQDIQKESLFVKGLYSGLKIKSLLNEIIQLDSLRKRSKDIDLLKN